MTDIIADSNNANSYDFFRDKVFQNIYVESFQLTPYNTGALVNLDLAILVYYKPDLDGSDMSDLITGDTFELILTF